VTGAVTRIDAHQHFWSYSPAAFDWIDPGSVLAQDFVPDDLMPLLDDAAIDGCIAVQACQTDAETDWLLDLAAANPRIVGVVGWIDLGTDDVVQRLLPSFVGSVRPWSRASATTFSSSRGRRFMSVDSAMPLRRAFRRLRD
jgi:predicted TIM-barrel fold metal-dependent hydrolase